MDKVEIFVTQRKAAGLIETYMQAHGHDLGRNVQYLLDDQRRGRYRDVIPHVKVRGRILYRVADLQVWADAEMAKGNEPHSGIFVIEAETELEQLMKLSVAVGAAKH